jgi:outer membrane protein OmpA-like peptidoglycan-associated protein
MAHASRNRMTTITQQSLAFSSLGVVLLCLAGCTPTKGAPAGDAPASASITLAPLPTIKKRPVSPNVNASEELISVCRLRFDDSATAPKFEFDKSTLAPEDASALEQIARCVTEGPLAGRSLDLVGRADPRGTGDYNMALGARRANSVGQVLLLLGVESRKMDVQTRGEGDATGSEPSGWQRDRRVDVLLRDTSSQ